MYTQPETNVHVYVDVPAKELTLKQYLSSSGADVDENNDSGGSE